MLALWRARCIIYRKLLIINMKQTPIRYCAWLYFYFLDAGNTQYIQLNENVNGEILQKAIDETVKVHPWVNFVLDINGADITYKNARTRFKAVEMYGPANIGGAFAEGRMFSISYIENKIWISYFHGLTDGVGRNRVYDTLMYYYFTFKNGKEYDSTGIWLNDGTVREGMFDDLGDQVYDVTPGFVPRPAPNDEDIFYMPETLEVDKSHKDAFVDEGTKMTRYHLDFKSAEFMAFCKENGHSPASAFQAIMARVLQEMYPSNKKQFTAALPVNCRTAVGIENTHRNGWTFAFQSVLPEQLKQSESELGAQLRADLKALISPDQLKSTLNAYNAITKEAEKYSDFRERMAFYAKNYNTFIGTYVFSYIGRLSDHGYLNEIEDVCWTSAIRRIPMITMVEVGDEFSITFLQNFETDKYAKAVAAALEKLGIPVTLLKRMESRGHAPVEYKRYYGIPEPDFIDADPKVTDSFESRIKMKSLLSKIRSAREASSYIEPGMTLGVSGFTLSGYPKKVAKALSMKAQKGEQLDLTVYSGASLGDDFDGLLTRSGVLKCRMPYQTNADLRKAINEGKVKYVDMPLSLMPKWVRSGYLNPIDVALIEASSIDENGNIIPTTSVGASETYVACAKKVIVEINTSVPENIRGIHDIYSPEPAPNTQPIPITKVSDRVGTPYIPCDPDKIVAIVHSDIPDCGIAEAQGDEDFDRMSENLIHFLEQEVEAGRLCNPLPPLQAGIGAVSNAVLAGLKKSNFEHLTIYSEVMQDSLVDLIECGKVDAASSTAITMSPKKMHEFLKKVDTLKDKIVLRPMEISNSPEVIRRLNVISINTVIEADLYGNTNSSYVDGSLLMNGVGGSGDFCQNSGLSIFITKSTAKNGKVSCIVPIASHVDHTSKTVQVIVTEQGVADLRGLDVVERARCIIDNCAHPTFRPALEKYLKKASILTDHPAFPYSLEAANLFHKEEV